MRWHLIMVLICISLMISDASFMDLLITYRLLLKNVLILKNVLCCSWHALSPKISVACLKLFCWGLPETPCTSYLPETPCSNNACIIVRSSGSHDPSGMTTRTIASTCPILLRAPTETWQLSTSLEKSFRTVRWCTVCGKQWCLLLTASYLRLGRTRYSNFPFTLA